MRVLVVGGGGREHALCWAIAASPLVEALYCAPGNAGIAADAVCVPVGAGDLDGILGFARDERIDFVVVGPEAPLVAGLVDRLADAGIKAFGPTAAAARLEGSKAFTKDLCARHGIPTAAYGRFTDPAAASAFIEDRVPPIVVKADGLAAGKGVTIAETRDAALDAARDMLTGGRFGAAGEEIVIEEFLAGEEASFFALVDGETALPLAAAQDHKRAGDGDTGPNTGGMGAYSPAPVVNEDVAERVMARIVRPTVAAMKAEGAPFRGVLYAGLMIDDGEPSLLEYNVRFGDPECQALIVRLASDLLPALIASADGVLDMFDLRWHDDAALTVVMASKGYPGAYETGGVIGGIDASSAIDGVTVFHAGTEDDGGAVRAAGGRVLGITACAPTIADAQRLAYRAVDRIDWPGGFCRRDIGARAID
ncbi:MAG: phosphoribosylamine--glycine ligase [Defluviicoccus sp.]|nr:phosphoribosylamine--glycine ligase [Defluviicoccus sp.]